MKPAPNPFGGDQGAEAGDKACMSRNTTAELTGIALNAEGADAPEWVQLIPAGPRVVGRDGRAWTLRDPAALVLATNRAGQDLPIDIEHASQMKGARGEPAPAVGWIKELDLRDGEIWGRVEWTDQGRETVSSRAYRYLSPVFKYTRSGGEIARMVSAGLTNLPNLSLTALNSEGAAEEPAMSKAILEALGLPEDASDADALTAINRLKSDELEARNRAEQPDADKFVPKADFDLAMNRVREFEAAEASRRDAEIEAAVDAATEAGKIAPASRDYHIAACRQEGGLERFQTMVDAAAPIVGPARLKAKPEADMGTALNSEETYMAEQMGLSLDEFRNAKAKEA